MDNQDIKILIISELSNNINDLINVITIDKSTYNIFSQKCNWGIIFVKNDIPLSNIIYDDTSKWLIAFKKEMKLKVHTNRLMDILENPKVEDCYGNLELFGPEGLSINYEDISFVNVLNVEGINMKEISEICNKLNKTVEEEIKLFTTCATCVMHIKDDEYIVSIHYNPWLHKNNIKYHIKRDNMKRIFYNILSHGIIPFDQYNGHRIKLII